MIIDDKEIKAQIKADILDLARFKEHCRGFFAEFNKYADIVDDQKKRLEEFERTCRDFFGDFNKTFDRDEAKLRELQRRVGRLEAQVAQLAKKK